MAGKTLINGTAYDISGGKTLVNGTAYSIASGKTMVNGTNYDINFSNYRIVNALHSDNGAYFTFAGKYGNSRNYNVTLTRASMDTSAYNMFFYGLATKGTASYTTRILQNSSGTWSVYGPGGGNTVTARLDYSTPHIITLSTNSLNQGAVTLSIDGVNKASGKTMSSVFYGPDISLFGPALSNFQPLNHWSATNFNITDGTNSNALLYNYKPAVRISDGVCGWYCKESDDFVTPVAGTVYYT